MTESFAELFESSLANQRIRPGMILQGLVVEVTDDIVIVNVGLKSEAVIVMKALAMAVPLDQHEMIFDKPFLILMKQATWVLPRDEDCSHQDVVRHRHKNLVVADLTGGRLNADLLLGFPLHNQYAGLNADKGLKCIGV